MNRDDFDLDTAGEQPGPVVFVSERHYQQRIRPAAVLALGGLAVGIVAFAGLVVVEAVTGWLAERVMGWIG